MPSTLKLILNLGPQLNINENIYLLHIDFYLELKRAKTAKCNLMQAQAGSCRCSPIVM